MSLKDVEEMTPRTLVNPKSVSAAIEYFFGRSELSQVVDQTNPLSQLTHTLLILGKVHQLKIGREGSHHPA